MGTELTTEKEIENLIKKFETMNSIHSCNHCNAMEVIIKELRIFREKEIQKYLKNKDYNITIRDFFKH